MQISDTGFSSVAPDFGAGSWRVPFPDIRAGHHRFSGCHSKEQPKRNRKLTHFGGHFGWSRAVSGPDQPPGKEHKVRASERRGCLYTSKVSSRQDEQFPYVMGHPILSTSPNFTRTREKRPNRGTVMPQIFGKGSSDLPIGFWGWALEGTFSRPKRRAPPIFRPPVVDITQKKPQIDSFWAPFWVFLGCFGLDHPPGEGHISSR